MKQKTKKWIVWPIRILLALGFLLAASGKLSHNPQVLEMFQNWGYSEQFALLIGVFELAGAILLLVPKASSYASIALMILMIGALVTHVINDPIAQILRPLIFMIFLSANLYFGKDINSLRLPQKPDK